MPGVMLGTVGYMAPEQVRSETADSRSDIFAVGAILYEMVTGVRAFGGASSADTISAVLREQPPDLRLRAGTPSSLARIIHRCLEKDPGDRLQSVRDLHFAIELVGEAQSATPTVQTNAHEISIAVLPFTNMSADADSQYFSDGLSEELINALTRLGRLHVAARTSAFRFRGREVDIREIGRQLNVTTVLEGSVRRAGTRLRITAQLLKVADGYHLWSERYDRELADVFEIQDEITTSIVSTLEPTLLGRQHPLVERHSTNVEAFEHYLKGQQLWYQRTPQSLRAAVASFEAAIRLDDHYALPHAGLAASYSVMGSHGFAPLAEARAAAEPAAARAMILAPLLAESHFATALCTLFLSEHWHTAEQLFRTALETQPRAAIPHVYYGLLLALRHRFEDAGARVMEAITLDPLSPFAHGVGAFAMYVARRYEEAIRLGQRALELHPDFTLGLWSSGMAYSRLGQHDRSLPLLDKHVSLSQRTPFGVGALGLGHAAAGNTNEALTLLDELRARSAREYVVPVAPLAIHVGLGNRDDIYAALSRCVGQGYNGSSIEIVLGPFLDELPAEPRFAELFRRLHLVPRTHVP
jgi:serine/threonine-protein kinase